MSAVDFSVDAGQRLGFNPSGLRRDVLAKIEDVLSDFADFVETFIFSDWPVATGTSLRAWTVYTDGAVLVVRNAVEYVSYVHEGDSADRIELEVERGWQRFRSEISQILDDVEREQRRREQFPATSSLLGDAARAAAARQLLVMAGVADLPGGSLFTSLRSAFTIQRISGRERERQRTRGRNR